MYFGLKHCLIVRNGVILIRLKKLQNVLDLGWPIKGFANKTIIKLSA